MPGARRRPGRRSGPLVGWVGVTRVLVLGARGMLGSMVARVLARHEAVEVVSTSRLGGSEHRAFDVSTGSIPTLLADARCQWVVNAVGVLSSRIDEADPASVGAAIDANAAFPNRLVAAAAPDRTVIQIATDGVYSGTAGPYDEQAAHDAPGVYARTKSLGEPPGPNVLTLRCSVIGPEAGPPASLLGWALSQPAGAEITGYSDQWWNGVTSLHFARLCLAVVLGGDLELPPLLHVVPADTVSKAALLEMALRRFGRTDVTVRESPSLRPADRTLRTLHEGANHRLWAAAGYPEPPSIATMIEELAAAR